MITFRQKEFFDLFGGIFAGTSLIGVGQSAKQNKEMKAQGEQQADSMYQQNLILQQQNKQLQQLNQKSPQLAQQAGQILDNNNGGAY